MAWNGWGEGLNPDYSKPPWVGGVMTLSHEEVIHVQTECGIIIQAFIDANGYSPDDNTYVVPRYNESDWSKCINGDTYAVIKQYDPAVHTLGIDENGIILTEEQQAAKAQQAMEESTGEV